MIRIEKIHKKDLKAFLNRKEIWDHTFLAISKYRLLSHFKNPNIKDDDIVLLLAYLNEELVGYMGIFIDTINTKNGEDKIGWLSTWWVHPKTAGKGVGREILRTMYEANDGKIGISQFTPSAKRVYDKSGYFLDFKINIGVRAFLRSNYSSILPHYSKIIKKDNLIVRSLDALLNVFINAKLKFYKQSLLKDLKDINVEYLNFIDFETRELMNKYNSNDLAYKSDKYFEWLKAYSWIQENQLISLSKKEKYAFSMYDNKFNVSLIKIIEKENCVGFVVLQQRNETIKVLFTYYDWARYAPIVSNIIELHSINAKALEIVCYDKPVANILMNSRGVFKAYKMEKQAIISKSFKESNFEETRVNFGDGDCAFA